MWVLSSRTSETWRWVWLYEAWIGPKQMLSWCAVFQRLSARQPLKLCSNTSTTGLLLSLTLWQHLQVLARLAKQLFNKLVQRSGSMALALQARGFTDIESHRLYPITRTHSLAVVFASYASLAAGCVLCFKLSTT